jgi:hypothetical protein
MINNLIILLIGIALVGCGPTVEKEYYPDGKILSEIETVEGINNGIAIWYHPNGEIDTKLTYSNGLKEGKIETYYESGKLKSSGYFKNDLQDGVSEFWFESGVKQSEQEYRNGVEEGFFREYLENGNIVMNALLVNDSTVFYEKYDGKGNWREEFRLVEGIIPYRAELNEECTFTFKLNGPQISSNDSVTFSISLYMKDEIIYDENGEFLDVPYFLNKVIPVSKNKINFSFIPLKEGVIGINASFNTNRNNKMRAFHDFWNPNGPIIYNTELPN